MRCTDQFYLLFCGDGVFSIIGCGGNAQKSKIKKSEISFLFFLNRQNAATTLKDGNNRLFEPTLVALLVSLL